MKFIIESKWMILLLLFSLGTTVYGVCSECTTATIVGAIASAIIVICGFYSEFKLRNRIESGEEAKGIHRDSKGNITSVNDDYGTY